MSKKNNRFNIGGKFDVVSKKTYYHTYSNVDGSITAYSTSVPDLNKIYIKQVIYSKPATIVFWNDGTKTIAKCHGDDIYSPETGLVICCFKKLVGGSAVKDLLRDWVVDEDDMDYDNPTVKTISSIRKEYRCS